MEMNTHTPLYTFGYIYRVALVKKLDKYYRGGYDEMEITGICLKVQICSGTF